MFEHTLLVAHIVVLGYWLGAIEDPAVIGRLLGHLESRGSRAGTVGPSWTGRTGWASRTPRSPWCRSGFS
ncbi:MAG: hypothetical protein JNK40_03540 [Chromatiales bacterium]|nr:hypothetical protein [Chromatiales bacterium]